MYPLTNRFAATCGMILGLALMVGLTSSSLRADDWNLKTSFSVDRTVEVPGAVLEPNTKYIIQLMELQGNRNVLRISNAREDQVISTFMTVDDRSREDLVEDPTFTFMEVPGGHPLPVKAWFYPGRITGFEFLYPSEQKLKIAGYRNESPKADVEVAMAKPTESEAISEALPTEESEVFLEAQLTPPTELEVRQEQVESNAVVESEEQGLQSEEKGEVEIERAKPAEPEVISEESQVPAQSEIQSTQSTETPDALPRTAGELPLIGLLGMLSLGLGLTVRFALK